MNSYNFEKWVKRRSIQNIPEKSVVIVYNVPYLLCAGLQSPSKYTVKAEIISSLWREGVASDVTRIKHLPYKLMELRMPKGKATF
jgi:hypothetical protein